LGKSKAVANSIVPTQNKKKKLKDVKTRRDTPYPMVLPARPVVRPTTQGLPPTPSKITLRKPSEPNAALVIIPQSPEEPVVDNMRPSASNSVTHNNVTTTTPAYSVTSSLFPLPPTPDRVLVDSTTGSVDDNRNENSDKYATPPGEPQALTEAKRASLARSLSDGSLRGITRSSTRRTTNGSANVMTIRDPVHENLWKNRSSLLITDSSLLDAKIGVSEHYSQHPLPTFANAPFSLLNPYRTKTDTSSQNTHNSTQEEDQAKNVDQLDGSKGAGSPRFDTEEVDVSSRPLKFDRKVEKVNLNRPYLTHNQSEVPKRNDEQNRGGGISTHQSTQLAHRPPLRGTHTAPNQSVNSSQLSLICQARSLSYRSEKNAFLSSLPLHKYLDLALSLMEDDEDIGISVKRWTQSVPKNIGSTKDQPWGNFSSMTTTQSTSPSEEEEKGTSNIDGHRSDEQLSTMNIHNGSRITNRAFNFTMLRNTFATRSGDHGSTF